MRNAGKIYREIINAQRYSRTHDDIDPEDILHAWALEILKDVESGLPDMPTTSKAIEDTRQKLYQK